MALANLLPWKRGEKKIPVKYEDSQPPMLALQTEINHLFDDFFRGFGLRHFDDAFGAFEPQLDVSETDHALNVTAELPGMDENDIDVSLTGQTLTIRGEKKTEKEDKGKKYYHLERAYGTFRRQISLPCEVEANKVEATFKKGILAITLPKSVEAQKQRKLIPIKAK